MSKEQFTIFGTKYRMGSYILLIRVSRPFELVFGKFQQGKLFTIPEGDYHYPDYNRTAQHEAFREMLKLARSVDMPVVIHCRDAWEDMLHILSEESHSALHGVMHCFSGDRVIADRCIRMGFKLSIPGTVTYKRSLLPDVIRGVSLDDLLTETDAPYLAPVPWRGKRNEPAYVGTVTKTIADIRGISLERATEGIARNAFELFRLPTL